MSSAQFERVARVRFSGSVFCDPMFQGEQVPLLFVLPAEAERER